jgi:lauroyl/myristoyl acyltransferase
VRDNIRTVLGDDFSSSKVERVARGHCQYIKRAYLAKFLPLLPSFDDPHQWLVQGLEHLDDALVRNRGAILTTAHLGYPRLIAPILRAYGYEVTQVVDGEAGPSAQKRKHAFEDLLADASNFRRWIYERTRVVIFRKDSRDIAASLDVRPIFDALSRNQVVMIVGDGMRAVEFARLSLLGRVYPFPTGFMKIAMLTKAPLLPVFVVEGDRRNRLRLEIHPPLQIDPAGDVDMNLQLFADILDVQIRRTPHLWNRWKTKNVFDRALAWSESQIRLRYEARWNKPASEREDNEQNEYIHNTQR